MTDETGAAGGPPKPTMPGSGNSAPSPHSNGIGKAASQSDQMGAVKTGNAETPSLGQSTSDVNKSVAQTISTPAPAAKPAEVGAAAPVTGTGESKAEEKTAAPAQPTPAPAVTPPDDKASPSNQKTTAAPEARPAPLESPPTEDDATTLDHLRQDPEAIRRAFETGEYPYKKKIRRADYEKQKAELQLELLKVQDWVKATGEKIVMLFEGRDAAGKGGTIKRFTEHLNPRGARVVALEKPTQREGSQWFFQRYISQLPAGGEIVLFDRSWYNRAGVERVMGFCTPNEYLEFMRQCPEIERMLVRSGVRLFKYWFSVTREEQLRRFKSREERR